MYRMNEPPGAASEPATAPTSEPAAPSASEPLATFEAFFRAEHTRLLRALFIVTGSEQEAEELMQDAFLAVWERWEHVREIESPTGSKSGHEGEPGAERWVSTGSC